MDTVLPVYLATVAASDEGFSILALVGEADFIVQSVLFLLVAMSITCWAIILNKLTVVSRASSQSAAFVDLFWKSSRLDEVYEQSARFPRSPVAAVFKAGYVELAKLTSGGEHSGMDMGLTENIERALRRASNTELTHLEKMTSFLATTGSTGPFIGLFGTVWGILRAFQKIGASGNASIQVVGPDIAHALVATAVGLLAAIPAVMAYNFFNSRIKGIAGEMDAFSIDFLNIVKRHYRGR
ncbi:MAG: protein TolQ [Myxococcota bacterium]